YLGFMATTVMFYVFAVVAIAAAISMVMHKNPLYSAVSLVGVFISLAGTYLLLAAPVIACVQARFYGGAIMGVVVFVSVLLYEDEDRPLTRLNYLDMIGGRLGVLLIAPTVYVLYAVVSAPNIPVAGDTAVGSTMGIGTAMYTEYLLPVEIVGIMLLMAIIGGV